MGSLLLCEQASNGASHLLSETDLESLEAAQFKARFQIAGKLGSGAFADVLKLRDSSGTAGPQDRALKVLRAGAPHPAGMQPEVALFREARALKHARHTNVVEFLTVLRVPQLPGGRLLPACGASARSGWVAGAVGRAMGSDTPAPAAANPPQSSCWALLLEYMQEGSMAKLIYKQMINPQQRLYSQADAMQWAIDISSGLSHLHSLRPLIIHRDLKLENILLQRPPKISTAGAATPAATGTGSSGTRTLPIAKISDFGLHVMLEPPPCPYLIKSEGGRTVIVFNPQQQQQQHEKHDQLQHPAEQQHQQPHPAIPCELVHVSSSESGSSSPSSSSAFMAAAYAAAAFDNGIIGAHSASSCCGCSSGKLPAIASGVVPEFCHLGSGMEHLLSSDIADDKDQQQQQQQQICMPLTINTLKRLSMSSDVSNGGGNKAYAVPLLPQTPGAANSVRNGIEEEWHPISKMSVSFCLAPVGSLEKEQGAAGVPKPAEGASETATAAVGPDGEVTGRNCAGNCNWGGRVDGSGAGTGTGTRTESAGSGRSGGAGATAGGKNRAAAAAAADDDDNVLSILATANSERDYLVSIPNTPSSGAAGLQFPMGDSSNHSSRTHHMGKPAAGSCTRLRASGNQEDCCRASSAASSIVGCDAGAFPTAASMLWDDLIEDAGCHQLLDEPLYDKLSCNALAYDLTGHTGSCMYMAPEVFRGEPYSESVDVFSLGVILYEIFSRTLMLYTHTPANSPDDCLRYAQKVADGYRPSCPKSFPRAVWRIVERCWHTDPSARPPASWVLQQLQQLQDADEAAAVHKGMRQNAFARGRKFFAQGRQSLRATLSGSNEMSSGEVAPAVAAAAARGRQMAPLQAHEASVSVDAAPGPPGGCSSSPKASGGCSNSSQPPGGCTRLPGPPGGCSQLLEQPGGCSAAQPPGLSTAKSCVDPSLQSSLSEKTTALGVMDQQVTDQQHTAAAAGANHVAAAAGAADSSAVLEGRPGQITDWSLSIKPSSSDKQPACGCVIC